MKIIPEHSYEIKNLNLPRIDGDFSVTFRITDSCNLKCEYCFWNAGIHYDYKDIKITIEELFKFFKHEKMDNIIFYFHGGEASTHPRLFDIFRYLHEMKNMYNINIIIEFQTNLAMSNLCDILEYIDLLNISYHYDELIKHQKHQVFMDNWEYLCKIQYQINTLDIMLENVKDVDIFHNNILKLLQYDNISNSEMIYAFCHYSNNPETYTKHIEFYKMHNKNEQQYIIDNKIYNTNDLFEKGLDCQGWKCDAGIQSIVVNGNGDVFNCGIHMTNYTNRKIGTPYTNLINDKHHHIKLKVLHQQGTICKWDYCGGDFYLPRIKK